MSEEITIKYDKNGNITKKYYEEIEYIKFYNETRIQDKLNYLSSIDYRLNNKPA